MVYQLVIMLMSKKSITKSGPSTKLDRDGTVVAAMDAAGKVPFSVNTDALTGNAVLLSMVTASAKDPIFGTYDHPAASHFLLDTKSLLKYMPSVKDRTDAFNAEVKQYNQIVKKLGSPEAAANAGILEPQMSEQSKATYGTAKQLIDTATQLKAAAGSSPEAEAIWLDFNKRVVRPSTSILSSVSGGYIRDVVDAARMNNKTFFYPQTAQAGTTRIQLATNTLNYQSSKKARGIVSASHPSIVESRVAGELKSGILPKNRKQLRLEAMIARNLEEGNVESVSVPVDGNNSIVPLSKYNPDGKYTWIKPSRLRTLEHQAMALHYAMKLNPKLQDVANMTASLVDASSPGLTAWASQSTDFVAENTRAGTKRKFIRPDVMPNFPKLEPKIDGPANQQTMKDLMEFMGLGKLDGRTGKWDPSGKSDHGDFVFNSLKTLGDYINPSKSVVSTRLTAEIDGIASGLTIQGYQYGDVDYLEHGGVLYDGDSTTPKGDIRNMVHNLIVQGRNDFEQSTLDLMGYDVERKQAFTEVYEAIAEAGKVKDLHKKATMTVAYSQEPKSAAKGSVESFSDGIFEGSTLYATLDKIAKDKLGFDNVQQLYDEMTVIEAKAITQGLGQSIQMAEAVQNGTLIAAVADEEYIYKLANGHEMVLTGSRSVQVGESLQLGDSSFTTYKTITDNAERAKSQGSYLRDAGSKSAKFAAVGPTQGMDAEIAQRTLINTVSKLTDPLDVEGSYDSRTDFAFIGQVFDAFLLNADSYEVGRTEANEQFRKVNENTDQAQQHIDAVHGVMNRLKAKVRQKLAAGEKFDVSPSGEYAAAFEAFRDLKSRTKRIRKSDTFGNAASQGSHKIQDVQDFFANKLNFDVNDGAQMDPKVFYKAVELYLQQTAVIPVLKDVKRRNDAGRKDVKRRIDDQLGDGRNISQYG